MTRRYVAFDIETAKDVPGDDFNWKSHRPLGISCIASQSTEDAEPRVWMTRGADNQPAPQMSRDDVAAFVQHLLEASRKGLTPLSWNGLSFDLDVLAEESELVASCRELALAHVDMMFHVVCEKGFPVALRNAASGLGLPGKLAGVEGMDAPSLWAEGRFETVTEYVAQDVRTTLAVALESEQRKSFAWKTRKGSVSSMPLRCGWLSVEEAMKLPLPDTSWMSDPISRSNFTAWL
ncbi:MAG: ribonuclease H-like domain-containing protein [Fuerstiella sp.]|nr:ribonuclease H-like domain-containing protein [Fuerstiella sp.]